MAKIVFWLGKALEAWDPRDALERGIGGSETAAIAMSTELAKLGHEVLVFADIRGTTTLLAGEESRGVLWLPYTEAVREPNLLRCDVFVSSRCPDARSVLKPVCGQAWLWMHDLHCGPDWENMIGTQHEKVLCLSNWARDWFLSTYPGVDPLKVVVTRNGLYFDRFANSDLAPGAQHGRMASGAEGLKVIFSSSPDRGLDRLLDFWPAIRDMAGDKSQLQIYYGFENWKRLAELHGNGVTESRRIAALEARIARMGDQGVFCQGRTGQADLARHFLQAQLWLYPTMFHEVSCITAMEAQAAGCKIVATRFGALPETAPGARFVDPPVATKVYEDAFMGAVKAALDDEKVPVRGAHIVSWGDVARQWDGWLRP